MSDTLLNPIAYPFTTYTAFSVPFSQLHIIAFDQNQPYPPKLKVASYQPKIKHIRRRVGKNLLGSERKFYALSFREFFRGRNCFSAFFTVLELQSNLWTTLFDKNTNFWPFYDPPSAQSSGWFGIRELTPTSPSNFSPFWAILVLQFLLFSCFYTFSLKISANQVATVWRHS